MTSESSPSLLALFNKSFFWSVLTGTVTGKKITTEDERIKGDDMDMDSNEEIMFIAE